MRATSIVVIIAAGLAAVPRPSRAQQKAEIDTILYRAADTLGMLRTPREVDRIATMIFTARGTVRNGRSSCVTERYEVSVRFPIPGAHHPFPVPGMRVDFDCASSDSAPQRQVQVVAGALAWDETEPGVGGVPAPGSARERLLELWTLPQGLLKAAALARDRIAIDVRGPMPVLTFPLPAPLDDVVAAVTFDPEVFMDHTMPNGSRREFSHRIEHVAAELDGVRFTIDYERFTDWNPEDYKSDVLLPGHIVRRRNGVTVLDIEMIESNTYNPYVITPVPAEMQQ